MIYIYIYIYLYIYIYIYIYNGCGHSDQKTLKLALSQEEIDGINYFFACWYKFTKTKNYFNDYCIGMFKNGHGFLCNGTQE